MSMHVNRVILGGNVGGEVRYDAERGECSFLLFSNVVTPPSDVFSDEVEDWQKHNPAVVPVRAFGPNAESVARFGRGALILFEGEMMPKMEAAPFHTEVRMNRLLFYRRPLAAVEKKRPAETEVGGTE